MSSNTKPIVVIYLPDGYQLSNSEKGSAMYLMKALNGNFGKPDEMRIEYTDYWKDYYWFCFPKDEIDAPEFQVFYPKDFTETDYKYLETLIHTALQELKDK